MKKRDFIPSNFKYASNCLFDLNSNTNYAIVVNKARMCKKSKFSKCDPAVSSRVVFIYIGGCSLSKSSGCGQSKPSRV